MGDLLKSCPWVTSRVASENNLKGFRGFCTEAKALTVLHVPYSLDSASWLCLARVACLAIRNSAFYFFGASPSTWNGKEPGLADFGARQIDELKSTEAGLESVHRCWSPHTHTLTLAHSHSHTLTHSRTHNNTLTLTLTHSCTHTLTRQG